MMVLPSEAALDALKEEVFEVESGDVIPEEGPLPPGSPPRASFMAPSKARHPAYTLTWGSVKSTAEVEAGQLISGMQGEAGGFDTQISTGLHVAVAAQPTSNFFVVFLTYFCSCQSINREDRSP